MNPRLKKQIYNISFLITFIGAFNWGLVGLGGYLGKNINLVSLVSQNLFGLEYIIYIIIGLMSVIFVFMSQSER